MGGGCYNNFFHVVMHFISDIHFYSNFVLNI